MAAAVAAEAVYGRRQKKSETRKALAKNMETNIDQALGYLHAGDLEHPKTYHNTCMKLGGSVDACIAMNALPSLSHRMQLVSIVKEVSKRKTEMVLPSFTLLMLPIKAACQIGWFPDGDKVDLLVIAKEVSPGYTDTEKMSLEPSNAHSSVENIVARFYPTMKVELILTSFVVKAGYGIFVADFLLSLGITPRSCLNLWLVVAQLDNMDTAVCISNPPNVDFLINGCGVPNRTKANMGNGPQLPSNVTKMVNYGVNILQVIGDFDGNYIIALVFMNPVSPDPSQLQDYVRPVPSVVDSDCSVIEMSSSRISLYCPISLQRIKTPVKGHLCNHPRCFDYNSFIELNSTIPAWKCPVCNNPVSHQDLRLDRDLLKILNVVANDVNDVIVSGDGSWVVAEMNRDTMSDTTVVPPAVSLDQTPMDVCALTQADCEIIEAKSMTMFTPPATSRRQTQVKTCTSTTAQAQAQSTIVSTPPAASLGQAQVGVCTTIPAQSITIVTSPETVTKPVVFPGQAQVNACTTNQAKSTTMLTPGNVTIPAISLAETEVKVCTTNQATMLTPPAAAPGQAQVGVSPDTETKPAVFPGQTQVSARTTNQPKSATPMVSQVQAQGNLYATTHAKSASMNRPPAPAKSQPDRNVTTVSPTQLPEASVDAMPSARMRGGLTGARLEAARHQYLAPPQQSIYANRPWSIPAVSLPSAFLTPQTPTSSDKK